jgi:hypothetical protein
MRHLFKTISAAILLLLASHVSIVRPAASAEAGAWTVASISGTAQFMPPAGDWRTLNKGQLVGIGQQIRTGDDGAVLLSRGDEAVTISPNSRFEMRPADAGAMTKIYQALGTLMFKVQKQPSTHFEVQTPYLIAAVKGTRFTVSIDASGGAVHVTEGLVEVANAGGADKVLVRPGSTASVASQRGSRVQIGTTPQKSDGVKGKQSQGPRIDRDLGAASVDIEHSSKGLFKAARDPAATQSASRTASDGAGDNGNAFGKDAGLGNSLGNGLGLSLGNGNGNGNVNSNAGGNGNGNGSGGGQGNGNGNGNAGNSGNAGGNGKGQGQGNS